MRAFWGNDLPGIDLAHCDDFSLGVIRVIPYELTLQSGNESLHLEPKVMQVLVALAREPGTVLSRDDLVEIVWEGRIVGDASINRALSHLRAAIEQLGQGSVTIETLPKVGYRLKVDGKDFRAAFSPRATAPSTRRTWGLVVLVLVAAVALAAWLLSRSEERLDRVHLVMLPLEAPDDSKLAAIGIEAHLRDQLTRGERLVVIASGSAADFAEEGRSPREIAQALGADFVLVGSVDTSAQHNVLGLRLFGTSGETSIWSSQIGQPSENAGDLLPQAVREVRTALGLPTTEAGDLPPLTRKQYRDYVHALGIVRARASPAAATAQRELEELIAQHPDFVPALVALAQLRLTMTDAPPTESQIRSGWKDGGALLDRALEIDPDHPQALGWRGFYSDGHAEDRLAMLQRAVALDPGDVRLQQFLAILSLATGRAEQALETYEALARIDPLWVRSLQAHDMAIELGERERAAATLAALRRTITNPSHLALLDSAEARAEGDLSRALAILHRLRSDNAPGIRQTANFYSVGIRGELGLTGEDGDAPMNEPPILLRMLRNDMPGQEEFRAAGIGTQELWNDEMLRNFAPRSYVMSGRPEVLVALYDDFADGPRDFLATLANREFDFRIIAPYLNLALDTVGRESEADEVLALALEIDAEFTAHGRQSMAELVRSAQIYAVAGQRENAIANLLAAREMGWPYQSAWLLSKPLLFKVGEDPAFANLKGDPRFDAMAREIEATRQRERAEALQFLAA